MSAEKPVEISPLTMHVEQFITCVRHPDGTRATLDTALEDLRNTAVLPDFRAEVTPVFMEWVQKHSFHTGNLEYAGNLVDRRPVDKQVAVNQRLDLLADVASFFGLDPRSALSYDERERFLVTILDCAATLLGYAGPTPRVRQELFDRMKPGLQQVLDKAVVVNHKDKDHVLRAHRHAALFNDSLYLMQRANIITWFDFVRTKIV